MKKQTFVTKAGHGSAGKKATALCLSLLFALLLAACAAPATQGDVYRFTDATGRTAAVPYHPQRVVSLMGSYAESWLLAGGTLTGITDDVLEENRFEVSEGTEIIGTVKHPNLEKVIALNPDFVLLSADIAGQISAAPTLEAAGIPYAFFKVERFSDYLNMLRVLCTLTDRPDLYLLNGADVQTRIDGSIARVHASGKTKSVLFLRAFSTGIKAKADDNIVSYILSDFGCKNIAEGSSPLLGDATSDLSMEIVLKADPDAILATSMGDEQAALRTFNALLGTDVYKNLTAVKAGKTAMLPKDLFHFKPNARWGESYEYLEEILFA